MSFVFLKMGKVRRNRRQRTDTRVERSLRYLACAMANPSVHQWSSLYLNHIYNCAKSLATFFLTHLMHLATGSVENLGC